MSDPSLQAGAISQQTSETAPPTLAVCSLWRRTCAYVVDAIIVAAPCMLIAIRVFDRLCRLGLWGPVIGFIIALPYFALLDSNIGKGQTLGKRWLNLRVVDKNGEPISFWKSLGRYSLFAVPYVLHRFPLPVTHKFGNLLWFHTTSLFSEMLFEITVYLLLFNRNTRQGLHDLLAGSYVATADRMGPLQVQPIWKGHWLLIGLFYSLFFSLGGVLSYSAYIRGTFTKGDFTAADVNVDARVLENMDGVAAAELSESVDFVDKRKKNILEIKVLLPRVSDDERKLAAHLVNVILDHDAKAKEYDEINVVLMHGFDLGVAWWIWKYQFSGSPYEWRTGKLR